MQELAAELSNDLLSLELSQNGSAGDAAELRSEDSTEGGDDLGGGGESGGFLGGMGSAMWGKLGGRVADRD
jgi:hypothetical protein